MGGWCPDVSCIGFLAKAIREQQGLEGEGLRDRFKSGEVAFEQALRAGVLTLNENDECEIPMPSMAKFIGQLAKERRSKKGKSRLFDGPTSCAVGWQEYRVLSWD